MEPKQHLIALARRHPGLWREVEKLRVRMGDRWPTWCYLPAPAWSVALGGGMAPPPTPAHVIDSGIAAAVGAWRMTQGIYRFDAGLYQALIATPVQGDIPVDVLYRMPEWCVYVETPGLVYAAEGSAMDVAGAWLHLDYGHKTGQTKLRAVLNAGETLIPIGFPILGSVPESLESALRTSALYIGEHGRSLPDLAAAASGIRAVMEPLTSLLLYLCADDAEIGDGTTRPEKPNPKRTKQGWKLFPPDKVREWDVGVRLGAALRRAASEPTDAMGNDADRARPRAHVRRAHWHTFLAGAGRSERRIKWLPPIPVNLDDPDSLPVTVRPIE